ncbi:MAG: GNAT family N-acetyltransferase [Planctomycetes bacterium]|nr:GNAT family N-acetyltransferase [Planctomycetota bacterium]MCA8946327.1 GNAT family N-acetyltransferase [Planctomycetota bacterium]
MGDSIRIRLYDHLRDARKFAALNYRTFRDSVPQDEQTDEEEFRQHHAWLLKHFAPHDPRKNTVFVAELDAKYAGHCWLGQQTDFFTRRVDPWIFDLSVSPEFRGKGVARRLHATVEKHLLAQGHTSIGLQVMAHNETAAKLYDKLGYRARALSLKKRL